MLFGVVKETKHEVDGEVFQHLKSMSSQYGLLQMISLHFKEKERRDDDLTFETPLKSLFEAMTSFNS